MSKKRTRRTPRRRRSPLKTTTRHKRKTNSKTIEFVRGKKDPEKVVKTLDGFDWSKFDYLRRRNKPDGHNYKAPEGITVIITIKKGRKSYTFTRLSPPDFVVNKKSVKDFTVLKTKELIEQWDKLQDAMEDDDEPDGETIVGKGGTDDPGDLNPGLIKDITVRFYYGPKTTLEKSIFER